MRFRKKPVVIEAWQYEGRQPWRQFWEAADAADSREAFERARRRDFKALLIAGARGKG